ncbi:MAG: glyoxylate reductase [Candidatus Thorarchaeota archaeon]|jgi:glyoxylate reductase
MENRVFVTRMIPDEGLNQIRAAFDTIVWDKEEPPSKSEIISGAQDCTGLVTLLSDPIDSELMDSLPKLKVIAQYAVGYDNIDVKSATDRRIVVTNTPGILTETTADLTWALILSTCRRVPEADRFVRGGEWRVAWGPKMLVGRDIFGSTLGIVGLGRIGGAVARRAAGFSMRILYHSESRNKEIEKELGVEMTNLETLLRESDIVSVHVPLTDETRGMIGITELSMMKQSSILVNTSRGQVVDEDALARALRKGIIAGAGLDVFREEPIPMDSALLNLENVVLLPHIGSASVNTRAKMAVMCATNLTAALKGKTPPNIVNPEVNMNE